MAPKTGRGGTYGAMFPEAFDSDKLDLVQQAFDAAWLELSKPGCAQYQATDGELRSLLGEKIMALASGGELDRNRLVARALQGFRAL